MDPINQEPVATVKDAGGYLTTLASVAAIIDITVGALTSIDGDGIELIGADGTSITAGDLHETASSLVYRSINDGAISYDAIQGSVD